MTCPAGVADGYVTANRRQVTEYLNAHGQIDEWFTIRPSYAGPRAYHGSDGPRFFKPEGTEFHQGRDSPVVTQPQFDERSPGESRHPRSLVLDPESARAWEDQSAAPDIDDHAPIALVDGKRIFCGGPLRGSSTQPIDDIATRAEVGAKIQEHPARRTVGPPIERAGLDLDGVVVGIEQPEAARVGARTRRKWHAVRHRFTSTARAEIVSGNDEGNVDRGSAR